MFKLVATSIRYRELLGAFVGRELRARYRGSFLGGFWLLLQPVIFLAVYYVVFVEMMSANLFTASDVPDGALTDVQQLYAREPGKVTALSMFVAMIPWQGLQECIGRSATTITDNGNLIKKISFPSELLPVYIMLYNLFNTVIGLAVFTVAAYLSLGILPSLQYLWLLPVILALQGMFMLGLGLLLAATTVFLRDLVQLVPMAMTVWFFITPIIFWKTPKPEYQWIMDWNPARYLMDLYRTVFIFPPGVLRGTVAGEIPWRTLGIFGGTAVVVLFLGLKVFRRKKFDFADEL